MDLESLLMGFVNSDLTTKAINARQSSIHEHRGMTNTARNAFDSRMRSDATTARMAAQNMQDAKAMVNVAQTYTTAIKSQLQTIQKVLIDATRTDANTTNYTATNQQINVNIAEILRLAQDATWNGIHLMDGTAGKNHDGIVELQAGNSIRQQKLINLLDTSITNKVSQDDSLNMQNLSTVLQISAQNSASTALTTLDTIIAHIEAIEAQYSYDYKSLENLSILFEEQADIFEAACTKRQTTPPRSSSTSSTGSYLDQLLADNMTSILSGHG